MKEKAVKMYGFGDGKYVSVANIDRQPTIDAVPVVAHEQVRWERDVAIAQLNDYGVSFGEKADCVRVTRCKDCKRTELLYGVSLWCTIREARVKEDDFCSYGERRSE